MRTIYSNFDVVHLTEDGEKTLCGRSCHSWMHNAWSSQGRCSRCESKGDFDAAFAEDRAVAHAAEQVRQEKHTRQLKRTEAKRTLLRETIEELASVLERAGYEYGITHHVSASVITLEVNDFTFKMRGGIWD